MRPNDNGAAGTVRRATRLTVIILVGFIVMLRPSLFHSPHVLHCGRGEGESLFNTGRTEDVRRRHVDNSRDGPLSRDPSLRSVLLVACNCGNNMFNGGRSHPVS